MGCGAIPLPSASVLICVLNGVQTEHIAACVHISFHRYLVIVLLLQIHGHVFDITKFLDDHPGGPEIVLGQAGNIIVLSLLLFFFFFYRSHVNVSVCASASLIVL